MVDIHTSISILNACAGTLFVERLLRDLKDESKAKDKEAGR